MLQAGIEIRVNLRQSGILPVSYRYFPKQFFLVYIYSIRYRLHKKDVAFTRVR